MKMTIMCPKCRKEANYIKEEDTEKRGFYAFNCKCGEKFMSPKNNPTIKIIEEKEKNNGVICEYCKSENIKCIRQNSDEDGKILTKWICLNCKKEFRTKW